MERMPAVVCRSGGKEYDFKNENRVLKKTLVPDQSAGVQTLRVLEAANLRIFSLNPSAPTWCGCLDWQIIQVGADLNTPSMK